MIISPLAGALSAGNRASVMERTTERCLQLSIRLILIDLVTLGSDFVCVDTTLLLVEDKAENKIDEDDGKNESVCVSACLRACEPTCL